MLYLHDRTVVGIGAEIGLLGESVGVFMLTPACPMEKVT